MFKRLNNVSKKLYEVELAKSKIEHREPIIIGFFILQYAKLRMLELFYNFFDRFCDVDKLEVLEMDTDSLFLALAHENLYDCIRPSKKQEWKSLREQDCNDSFQADLFKISSLEHVFLSVRSMINGNQDFSRKKSDLRK